MHYTAAFRTTVPPPEPELFDLFEEPGGVRPNLLLEPQGPHHRDQLRTVEHTVGFAAGEFLQVLDTQKPVVQVIAVPKITKDLIQPRLVDCDQRYPQMVEQLVEVPTTVSYSSLQRTVEQLVDIPVPGGGGPSSGLHGFLPRQSSTAALSSAERISERIVEQSVDIPVGRGLQDFRPGQSSSSVARSPAEWLITEDEANQGVFRTFPQIKKVRHNLRTRGRHCLRTRAHGRRLLMTRPWCLRRRRKRRSPRTSLSSLSSTCSRMGVGGGTSGTQLASGTAGGWPLPMGPRLAILFGGLHGSSAVGHGDDASMIRQWIHVPASTYCGGAHFSSSSKWWILLFFTETGTHRVKLCKVVDYPVMAQRTFPWSCAADHRDFPVAVY